MKTKCSQDGPLFGPRSGSGRVVVTLLIVAVMLVGYGTRSLYIAWANRTPTVLSYQECLKERPAAAWLRITNCELDILHASWLTYIGDKSIEQAEYYVPLRDPSSPTVQTCMLLKTMDPEIKKVLKEAHDLTLKSEAAQQDWVDHNLHRICSRQDVQGLVLSDWDMKSSRRQKLASVQKNLAEDFIILDSNAQPSFAAGSAMCVSGLGILGAMSISLLQSGKTSPEARPQSVRPPRIYLPPANCPMCRAPVTAEQPESTKTCSRCGADLTRSVLHA